MRTRISLPLQSLVSGVAVLLAVAGCGQQAVPSVSPTPVAQTRVSLLAVPFTFAVPADAARAVRAAPVAGDWIDELAPAAATQLTYLDATGQSHFLGNAMWFDKARLEEVTKPTEPPPGTTMATLGDRVLVVAATVEMPFEPDSQDGKTYGALSERLRDASSYSEFLCPSAEDAVQRKVTPVVRDVVTAYFLGKELSPITIEGDQETVRDVQEQIVGTHACFNDAAGGEGAYVGAVPAGAASAVTVYVHHKPYPVTHAESTFVTLARVGDAWSIVAEGTGA